MSASISFSGTIPLVPLNTAIYMSLPLYFRYPSAREDSPASTIIDDDGVFIPLGRRKRSLDDTSLEAVGDQSPRSAIYSGLESGVALLTGADGHSCLLRAMCEASSTPRHDEGLIGDAITFLLTTNYVSDEPDTKFKKYFAAQARGKVKNIGVQKQSI